MRNEIKTVSLSQTFRQTEHRDTNQRACGFAWKPEETEYMRSKPKCDAMALKNMFRKEMWYEWALIMLIAFLLYDVTWLVTDNRPLLDNIRTNKLYIAIDLLYCAIFSFAVISASMLIARIGNFAKLTYRYLLLQSLATLTCNVVISIVMELLYYWLIPGNDDSYKGGLIIACILATISSLAHNMQYYIKIISDRNAHSIAMEKKMMKLHLDPHFVFNNLNILAGLVRSNPDGAEEFIIRLSKVYRHIISNINKDVTSLRDAIDFAFLYVEVLNVRFLGKIDLQVDQRLKEVRSVGVMSSSLHLLIENAVKHNMPEGASVLTIHVFREGNSLVVQNNILLSRHADSIPSMGVGLKNLQDRYRLQCGELPEIRQSADSYEVLLPLLPIEE